MELSEIKGVCPRCNQGVAGYTTTGPSVDDVIVKCNNGHWALLEEWNRNVPNLAKAHIPLPGPPPYDPTKQPYDEPLRHVSTADSPATYVSPLSPENFAATQGTTFNMPPPIQNGNTSTATSRSALELLQADYNPDKSALLGHLKLMTAALITECEKLRDAPKLPEGTDDSPHIPNINHNFRIKSAQRSAALAITSFETGMMHLEKALRFANGPNSVAKQGG